MKALDWECQKQREQYDRLTREGFEIIEDIADLAQHIGTIRTVDCYCEMWTPRLLCKLFVSGTEYDAQSFHLVPLHQIVRWSYMVPQPGDLFTTEFVIGTRKVGDYAMVPALRLPLH